MNIIFLGTPEFVLPLPQALLGAGFELVAVVTNPDRPVGRKQILTPSPVKLWAQKHNIPVLTPKKFDPNFLNLLISQYPNIHLFVVAAYGKILPPELLKLPRHGALCVHPSLLPKYRGASPVQAAIINGDRETGVTIFQMDEKVDHGPIVSQFKEKIRPDETAESLYFRLFQEGAEVLLTLLPAWVEGRIKPREQDHEKATFTKLLQKEDGFIPYGIIAPKRGSTSECKLYPYNLKPTPENIERFIRAMSPWPGAWVEITIQDRKAKPILDRKKRLRILRARFKDQKLILDYVQLEGKTPVSWEQFSEAYPEVKLIS